MKKILILTVCTFLIMTSCSELKIVNERDVVLNNVEKPLSRQQINKVIDEAGHTFYWKEATLHQLWSAVLLSGNAVDVGFGSGTQFLRESLPNSELIEQELLALIAKYEEKNITELAVTKDEKCNAFIVKIKNITTLAALRNHQYTAWVDAIDYQQYPSENQRVGATTSYCMGGTTYIDKNYISERVWPGTTKRVKVPWSYTVHGVEAAWNKGAYGQGITIGFLDTGISAKQPLLGSYFKTDYPARTISSTGTNDDCGHGTAMITLAAGGARDALPIGVAPRASVVSYQISNNRGWDNALLTKGINALTFDNNVKIICLSAVATSDIASERVNNAIESATLVKRKLFFAAAGEDGPNKPDHRVRWPANLPRVMAVTGVRGKAKEKSATSRFTACTSCNYGAGIDFAIYTQDIQDERVGVAANGPDGHLYTSEGVVEISSASTATAMMAGMAALLWSKEPKLSNQQVFDKLIEGAFPGRRKVDIFGKPIVNIQEDFGYGMPHLGWSMGVNK